MFMTDTYTKDKQMVLAGIQPEEIKCTAILSRRRANSRELIRPLG